MKQVKPRHTPDRVGIYRVPDRVRGGHYLFVVLRRNGKVFEKRFFERRYGGEQGALQLAQAWRDSIIAAHPPMSLARFCAIVRSNNTSGIPGVVRNSKQYRTRTGTLVQNEYWSARIPLPDGKSRQVSFPVRVYGESEALRLATEARLQGLAELEGIVFRAAMQPQQVSSEADIARLEALLRQPAQARQQREEQRQRAAQERARKEARLDDRRRQIAADRQAALAAPTNRTGEPYIGRNLTGKGTGNWRVSIERDGKKHRKTFSDASHGGADAALVAAKAWRDAVFLALPTAHTAVLAARVNSTNTSGVAGVFLSKGQPNGEAASWVARSPVKKGQPTRSKRFSIAKYGERHAYALAVEARHAFLAELGDARTLHHRAARQLSGKLARSSEMSAQQGNGIPAASPAGRATATVAPYASDSACP